MSTRNTTLIVIILSGLAFIAAAILYPQMSEPMATHWGPSGAADGYGSRFAGLFLMPIIALAASLLMLAIPLIDPLKRNIEKFRSDYNLFVVFISAFFYYMFALTVLYNFGMHFSMTTFIMPAMAALMFLTGRMLKRTRRNYMIGIRTPWTLANDVVWEKTHRFGGTAFQVVAVVTLVGMLFPPVAIFFMMAPLLAAVVLMFVYSYIVFRQEEKKSNASNGAGAPNAK